MSIQVCPRCQYKRKASDMAPEWQCPSCHVVYAKFMAQQTDANDIHKNRKVSTPNFTRRTKLDWFLNLTMLVTLAVFIISLLQKTNLPGVNTIDASMQQHPIQSKTERDSFRFSYRGQSYNVEPVAEYELWGIVVSHNDITGMTDITHTEDSVDLKDICVVWGTNATNNDYRQANYSSGDFTCFVQYQYGTQFTPRHLSNNHLLSDSKSVRNTIRNVHIGDQVYLKGMLVNYAPTSNPGWVRRTSTTRYDDGKTACEVVFVEQFKILHSLNGHWYVTQTIVVWLFLISLLAKVLLIYFQPAWNKAV